MRARRALHRPVIVGLFVATSLGVATVEPTAAAPTPPTGGFVVAKVKVAAGGTVRLHVADYAGVPTGAAAVSMNVTTTEAETAGFVTVYPCGSRPTTSSLNVAAGQTVANAVISPVSADGDVCLFSSAAVHLIADVNGWFPGSASYHAITPTRLFDTRPGEPAGALAVATTKVGGDATLSIDIDDLPGVVPPGATAIAMNVTVTGSLGAGFVTVYPCGERPLASNLNFVSGQTVPNLVIAPISADRRICFFSSVAADLVADASGWFDATTGFNPVTPIRVFDTRPGVVDGARVVGDAKVGGGYELRVDIDGLGGVLPDQGVTAVALDVAATEPDDAGFVTVYPCGARPLASSVNFLASQTVPNLVIAPVSADGSVCFFSSVPTHLVVDISGWFAAAGGVAPLTPVRLFDTRPGTVDFQMDVGIHPILAGDPVATGRTIDAVYRAAAAHGVARRRVIVLFSPTASGADFAAAQLDASGCMAGFDAARLAAGIAVADGGSGCGLAMKVADWDFRSALKNTDTTASHEMFHVLQGQMLRSCTCSNQRDSAKVPRWMLEGAADFVGYSDTYGMDPVITPTLRTLVLALARDPSANVSLPQLDHALFDGSIGVDIRYARAFLAVSYLVEITSKQKVLIDFYENTVVAEDWEPAFVTTFGFTEAQFDQMFTTWLASQP